MTAQLVHDRVVVFVKRQVTILYVAHQQAATLEVPGYSFTDGVNEQLQRPWRRCLGPPEVGLDVDLVAMEIGIEQGSLDVLSPTGPLAIEQSR